MKELFLTLLKWAIAIVLVVYLVWPISVFLVKLLFGITVGLLAIVIKLAFVAAVVYFGYLIWKAVTGKKTT